MRATSRAVASPGSGEKRIRLGEMPSSRSARSANVRTPARSDLVAVAIESAFCGRMPTRVLANAATLPLQPELLSAGGLADAAFERGLVLAGGGRRRGLFG